MIIITQNWIFDVKPTTKAELALNGMVELALRRTQKPLALAVLAEKQSISLSYLEQVFASLRKSGLVVSVRGPGGGYLLSRSADSISTGEIISALDEKQPYVSPNALPLESSSDSTKAFWDAMSAKVLTVFNGVSLQDVVEGRVGYDQIPAESAPRAAE